MESHILVVFRFEMVKFDKANLNLVLFRDYLGFGSVIGSAHKAQMIPNRN